MIAQQPPSVVLTTEERAARVAYALKVFVMHCISSEDEYYDTMVIKGGYRTVTDAFYKESGLLKKPEVADFYDKSILPLVICAGATLAERQIFGRVLVDYYKAEDHVGLPLPQ